MWVRTKSRLPKYGKYKIKGWSLIEKKPFENMEGYYYDEGSKSCITYWNCTSDRYHITHWWNDNGIKVTHTKKKRRCG